jgi:hypothetical protein
MGMGVDKTWQDGALDQSQIGLAHAGRKVETTFRVAKDCGVSLPVVIYVDQIRRPRMLVIIRHQQIWSVRGNISESQRRVKT